MIFKSLFFATTALLCVCTVAAPAQAGQLFPPNNIGSNPNISCPHGGVLTWDADHVDCVNPTPGVTVTSCPAGQVLTGISSGSPICVVPTPTLSLSCPAGEVLTGILNGAPTCIQAGGQPTGFHAGWPDAIICYYNYVGNGNPAPFSVDSASLVFWHDETLTGYSLTGPGRVQIYHTIYAAEWMAWNDADGSYNTSHGAEATGGCAGMTMSEIVAEGQAFGFAMKLQ